MIGFLRFSVTALVIVGTPIAVSAQPLNIAVSGGVISGIASNGVDAWLGVPYATPPVGPLRWQPPKPVTPWRSPMKADKVSGDCAQNQKSEGFSVPHGTEDCLYLNIYRAGYKAGSKLPVMVWIHGGGFQDGAASDYDPAKIVTRGKQIVVTINYRLGVLGFLAHPALDHEGHKFANYGLMDQQAALSWIHHNIASFGGDPGNVTIAGESAGGNSVLLHLALQNSRGMFQHAIVMSGSTIILRYPLPGAPRSLPVAETAGLAFAKAAGCERSPAAPCLRQLSTKQVLETQSPYLIDSVVIDGSVVPGHPVDMLQSDAINRVTLINGTTRDENRLYVGMQEIASGHVLTGEEYSERLAGFFGQRSVSDVMAEYPLESYDSPSETYAAATSDVNVCAARDVDRILTSRIPVFAYEFNDGTAPSLLDPTTFPLRDAHSFELQYLFSGYHEAPDRPIVLNQLQDRLSNQIIDEFARPSQLPTEWVTFDSKRDNIWTYQLPKARMVSGKFATMHHCAFWDRSGSY